MEESAVEAAPEAESLGDMALSSDLSDTEDELMADDMATVAESATEEMAGDVYELNRSVSTSCRISSAMLSSRVHNDSQRSILRDRQC